MAGYLCQKCLAETRDDCTCYDGITIPLVPLPAYAKVIVGIAGRRGAGKDTCAAALAAEGFSNEKFAGGLKNMLRAFLEYCHVCSDTIERMIEGDLKEVPSTHLGGKTPRFSMQALGTDWGRNMISETLWVDGFDAHIAPLPKVAVTDLRFPNEVQRVKDRGGKTILVRDPNRAPDGAVDSHASETQIDTLDVDHIIENDKKRTSIKELHRMVQALVGE